MMNFIDLAKERFSVRSFQQREIEESKLMLVLEAFRVAPSAVNLQPWHLIIVASYENKQKIYEAYPREWLKSAPMLLVACGDRSVSWKRSDGKDHLDIDLAIAIDHLTLQAAELGLGTCWVCNFNASLLKQSFALPANIEPVVIIPLGYPIDRADASRHSSKRKALQEFVHWETFGKFIY